jgi:hypothetical protein
VMLACLALVPFLAIYGKQIPDFYHAVVDAYKARMQQKSADPLANLGSDAPAWAPTNDRRSNDATWPASVSANTQPPTVNSGSPPALWNSSGAAPQPLATSPAPQSHGEVQPAVFATPVDPAKPVDPAAAPLHGPATASAAGTPDTCTVQFRHVEQRLRELGATYYFLETWGAQSDRYRFYCQVALAGNNDSGHNRVFQATDVDPLQAMKSVLDQVELWRSGKE